MQGRIYFKDNPWPKGHAIKKLDFSCHLLAGQIDHLEYSAVSIPMFYVYNFGQYLLLLIGSVNPRKLSKTELLAMHSVYLYAARKLILIVN